MLGLGLGLGGCGLRLDMCGLVNITGLDTVNLEATGPL